MEWSAAAVIESFAAVSNWGRWGADDERGTLNFITPEKTVAASSLVRSGRVVSASLDLQTETTSWSAGLDPLVQRFSAPQANPNYVFDWSTVFHHGWERTHLDALAHAIHDGRVYGGRRAEDVWLDDGLHFASILAQRDGIVTRGVLLDVAAARGRPWLEPTDTIRAADLEAAEQLAGVHVTTGDAAFIRAGVLARGEALGPQDPSTRTGLGPDCAVWMHEREVAMVAIDCPEQAPSRYPEIGAVWHIAALVYMGLSLLDAVDMEAVRAACHDHGRFEFLCSVAPLRIPRGSGSVCNPLCVF